MRALVFAVMAGIFVTCTAQAHESRPDTVIFDAGTPPNSALHFNWYKKGADLYRGAAQSMLEPLFQYDPATGDLLPWLAAEPALANEDFTVYTLQLRRDVYWSTSARQRFDAEDIAFSLQLVLSDPAFDAPAAKAMQDKLRRVEIVAPFELRLSLTAPDPQFIAQHFSGHGAESFFFVPEHQWSQLDNPTTFDNATPVGTGAYVLSDPDRAPTRFVRFERWWGQRRFRPLPAPDHLEWHHFNRAEDRVRALAQGGLDSTPHLSIGLVDGLTRISPVAAPLNEEGVASTLYWTGWQPDDAIGTTKSGATRLLIHRMTASEN